MNIIDKLICVDKAKAEEKETKKIKSKKSARSALGPNISFVSRWNTSKVPVRALLKNPKSRPRVLLSTFSQVVKGSITPGAFMYISLPS